MTAGLWCDGFDADLLAVVPGAETALGPAAAVELHTYNAHPTNGKINCPAAFHTDWGLSSFFSTRDRDPLPANHSRYGLQLVACTFAEAVRDEWVHGSTIIVNRCRVWTPLDRHMQRLMFDVRGWTVLDGGERYALQRAVRMALAAAAVRLLEVLGAGART